MPSRRCPHCRKEAAYTPGANTFSFGRDPQTHIRLDVCQHDRCGGHSVVILDSKGAELVIYPALDEEPDELLPDDVKVAFREALQARNEGIWNGSVLMCRRALEEATAVLAEELPQAKRNAYLKKVLYDRIEQLADAHVITPDLRAWAHEGRLGGKLGAHGGTEKQWNTELDAEEIVEFATWFFRYVFILPQQLAERKERVTERSVEADQETPGREPEAR